MSDFSSTSPLQGGGDVEFIKFKEGSHQAYSHYYYRFSPVILHFLKQRTKDSPLAEDLTADTFLKLWTNRSNFQSSAHIKSFLYRVAGNAATDALRKKILRSPSEHRLELLIQLQDNLPYVRSESIDFFYQFLKTLPDAERDVMHLLLKGYTTKEIASMRNTSPQTVINQKGTISKKLKNHVNGKYLLIHLILFSLLVNDNESVTQALPVDTKYANKKYIN